MNEVRRRRARGRRTAAVLTAVLTIAIVLGIPGYYAAYRVLPWASYPSRLQVCGREFLSTSSPETQAAILKQGYHLVRRGDLPGWLNDERLWSFDRVDGHMADALPGGCHVVMWVRGGSDSFKPYELEGGP